MQTILLILQTRRTMYLQRNIQQRSRNQCCRVKPMRIKYSECAFVALSNQYSMRMRRIAILPSVACPVLPYFSTLSHKLQDFREEVMELDCGV
jgi:non-ribosomal peptide synthetase component E (peptide arylation enzyme)